MSDTTTVVAVPAGPDRMSNVDWGAVIGGALIASALSFVLLAFGSAAGLASVSPYSWNNPSGTTLSIVGVAWFSVVMIGSFLVGGFFAGRYRRAVEATVEERESRDGAHGLLVWALSLVIGLLLAAAVASATARGVASVAGGAAAVAAQNVSPDGVGRVMDTMLRPGPQDAGSPARVENPRAEIARVMSASTLSRGEIAAPDRDYIARIVAAEARIPQDEARRRVDTAIEQGKQAADAARKITAGIAFLIGAVSIIAAGAAFLGAGAGGRRRDEGVATIW
jgi:hypothetical protein